MNRTWMFKVYASKIVLFDGRYMARNNGERPSSNSWHSTSYSVTTIAPYRKMYCVSWYKMVTYNRQDKCNPNWRYHVQYFLEFFCSYMLLQKQYIDFWCILNSDARNVWHYLDIIIQFQLIFFCVCTFLCFGLIALIEYSNLTNISINSYKRWIFEWEKWSNDTEKEFWKQCGSWSSSGMRYMFQNLQESINTIFT